MNEVNLNESKVVECSGCRKTLKKFFAGRYANFKDKRWCDENGRQWNGKVCPQCHADKCAQRKRLRKGLSHVA